jgi:hypothetical protein
MKIKQGGMASVLRWNDLMSNESVASIDCHSTSLSISALMLMVFSHHLLGIVPSLA